MWQLLVSFLAVVLFVAWRQGFSLQLGGENLLPVLILGIINTGVGCYLYFSAIGELPVQSVAICGYLEPLSALLFSAALPGERLNLLQLAGAMLILGGAVYGEVFRFRK